MYVKEYPEIDRKLGHLDIFFCGGGDLLILERRNKIIFERVSWYSFPNVS